ncbi:MAG: sugar kinase, partial [Verrucomicrobia bacterium]
MQKHYIGIEIGGTKLQIVVGDETGKIIERRRLDVVTASGGAGIREQINETLAELIPAKKPTAIGIGFGGPVDWRTG